MSKFTFLIKELWKGESVTRAYLNSRLSSESLRGKTIDIGGGKDSAYISFMKRVECTSFEVFDPKVGKEVDFENDRLPLVDNSYDTVIFLNVMEHIFNYQHIADEIFRIVKPKGQIIGFVPFLMWYHPDHKDYFRYTHEALALIFEKSGAKKIHIESISEGPFMAMVQMISQSVPRFVAICIFILNYVLDKLYLNLRPNRRGIYALGYYFVIDK